MTHMAAKKDVERLFSAAGSYFSVTLLIDV